MKEVTIENDAWLKFIPLQVGRYKFKNVIYDFKRGKKRPVVCWLLGFRVQTSSKRHAK